MRRLRFLAVFLLVAFMTALLPPGNALAYYDPDFVRMANDYVYEHFGTPNYFTPRNISGRPLEQHFLRSSVYPGARFPMLVWGSPHADDEDDYKNGQYRFIGYSKYDENVTNVEFPADSPDYGRSLGRVSWIEKPWNRSEVRRTYPGFIKSAKLDGVSDPAIIEKLRWGLWYTCEINGFVLDDYAMGQAIYQRPQDFVHITIPPTYKSWGMGVIFHEFYWNGRKYISYASVPIPPEPPPPAPKEESAMVNLAVTAKPKAYYSLPWRTNCATIDATAVITVKRSDTYADVAPATLTVDGPAGPKTYSFYIAPDETKTFEYTFPVSRPGRYKVTAEAWPTPKEWDGTPEDNTDQCWVWVVQEDLPLEIHVELGG